MATKPEATEPEVTESLTAQMMKGGKDVTPESPYPGDMIDEPPAAEVDRGDDIEVSAAAPEPEPEVAQDQVAQDAETQDQVAQDSVTQEQEPEQPKRREQRIPKSRFDEVNEKYKAARAELEELKNRNQAETEAAEGQYDFDAKEQEYLEMVLDGKTADAAALRREIRAAERAQIQAEIDARSQNSVRSSNIQQGLQEMSDAYAEAYPAFDPNSDTYDADAIDEVKALYAGYYSQSGNTLVSFQKAVEAVIKMRDWQEVTDEDGEVDDAPVAKPSPKQVAAKVAMAKKQPPSLAEKGTGASALDIPDLGKLSEREFDALPDSTKARLRGDFV